MQAVKGFSSRLQVLPLLQAACACVAAAFCQGLQLTGTALATLLATHEQPGLLLSPCHCINFFLLQPWHCCACMLQIWSIAALFFAVSDQHQAQKPEQQPVHLLRILVPLNLLPTTTTMSTDAVAFIAATESSSKSTSVMLTPCLLSHTGQKLIVLLCLLAGHACGQ